MAKKKKWKASRSGRPRTQGIKRERNGRASRAEAQQEIRRTAVRQRMKRGLSEAQAKTQEAGTVAGLMYLDKDISYSELQVALLTGMIICNYYHTQGIPAPTAQAMDWNRVAGRGSEIPDKIAQSHKAQYAALCEAVNRFVGGNYAKRRNVDAAIRAVCVQEEDIRQWPARHMFVAFKQAMGAIAQEFHGMILMEGPPLGKSG